MTAQVMTLNVATADQMQQVIMSYVAQGFVVSTQTLETTTLFKKKEFSVLWTVIGLALCLVPLLIYCIAYAQQSDQMVVVRVDPAAAVHSLRWSEDRQWWSNGAAWVDSTRTIPPGVRYSPDGRHWWDGQAWRQVPQNQLEPPSTVDQRTDTTS